MAYVVHFCRNSKCNKAWIDKDLTNVKTIPPKWKYCIECAKQLGIDFEKQTLNSNSTPEEIERKIKASKKASLNRWHKN